MFSHITFTTREVCILIAISYAFFWISVSDGIQYVFYPKEAESKGATPTQYGLVFATESLVLILLSPFSNRLITWCSVKSVFIVSLYMKACVLLGFAFTDRLTNGDAFIWLCIGLRVLEGLASLASATAIHVIMPLMFTNHLSLVFVIQEVVDSLGEIMGPSIGAVLYEWGGYKLPFLVMGVVVLVSAPIVSFIFSDDQKLDKGSQKSDKSFTQFMSDFGVILDSMALMCLEVIVGFNMSTLEPHLRQFNLRQIYIGCVFSISCISFVIFTPIWSRLMKSGFDYKTLSIIASLFSLTGLAFIGPLHFIPFHTNIWLIVMSIVLIGIGTAGNDFLSFVGSLNDAINRRGYVDDVSTYSLVSAMYCFSTAMGFSIGTFSGGYLLERIGYINANLVIFLIQLSFILLLLIHKRLSAEKPIPYENDEKMSLIKNTDKMV